jgi:tRNA modification GTPase
MDTTDTIVAISSTVGVAARMIVRMSGPDALRLAQQQIDARTSGEADLSRGAHFLRVKVAGLTVPAEVLVFPAPHSFTGDHAVEFHLPGSPILAGMLVGSLIESGARQAEAGEFIARAFLNGKIDLTEVEGVAAIIAASNQHELDASRRLASGELSLRLKPLGDMLTDTLALIEAGIDFSDEGISFLARNELQSRLDSLEFELRELLTSTSRFEKRSHQPRVVLAGRPNAGKSTLLNALSGRPRAVVSEESGTTRDTLSASVALAGQSILLVDVAGLEPIGEWKNTTGRLATEADRAIAAQMRSRAIREIERADAVVLVHDLGDARPTIPLPVTPSLVVRTKCDLHPAEPGVLCVSAHTGEGLDDFKRELARLVFDRDPTGDLTLNARHVRLLTETVDAIGRAQHAIESGPEFVALELRIALDRLGEVTGAVTPDDVLGRIFATFCIGK